MRDLAAERAQGSLPAGFDPTARPIIARHIFGVEPFRPLGEVAAEVVADLQFRRQVERSIMTLIDQKLDTYAELEPEALEVTGGDGFWPVPVRKVWS